MRTGASCLVRQRNDIGRGDPGLGTAGFVAREDLGVELEDLELGGAGDSGVEPVLGGLAEVGGAVEGSGESERLGEDGRFSKPDRLGPDGEGRCAGEGRLGAEEIRREEVRLADERRDEAVPGPAVDLQRRADLLEAAGMHHRQAIRDRESLLLVVRHVDRGEAGLLADAADLAAHLEPELRVEVREGFVEEQAARLHDERAGERDALLLPAGELVGPTRGLVLHLHRGKGPADPVGGLRLADAAHAESEGDVLGECHVRPERVALEDHARVSLVRGNARDVLAAYEDSALIRFVEARDVAQKRRLAASRRPEQEEELAGLDLKIDMIERGRRAEALREVLDLDGDGEIESVSISLDDHSESFYILVNDGGNLMDYVVPGTEFTMRDQYGVKAFKGGLRGFSADLDKNDKYTEVGVEMMRDTWDEYKTIMVRYDGTKISASIVPGSLSAVNNAGAAQFSVFDPIYGVHKLYRTYSITSEVDFLKAQTEYFFTDTNVEKTSYMYNPDFNIQCTNLNGEACTITSGSLFYWSRTDYETYVDVISVDNLVYRLPITVEEYEYESGPQKVYKIGDHDAAEIKTR